jgi:ABC-type phosphate transport system auxiliary subunit
MSKQSPIPTDIRALLHERFEALLNDCDHVMDKSAHGQLFNDLDQFLFTEGRKVIKEVLEQKLQERIKRTETTDEGKECPHCKKKRPTGISDQKQS